MTIEIAVEIKEAMGEEHIGLEDIMQHFGSNNPGWQKTLQRVQQMSSELQRMAMKIKVETKGAMGEERVCLEVMQEVSSIKLGWEKTLQGVQKMSLIWPQRMVLGIKVETKEAKEEKNPEAEKDPEEEGGEKVSRLRVGNLHLLGNHLLNRLMTMKNILWQDRKRRLLNKIQEEVNTDLQVQHQKLNNRLRLLHQIGLSGLTRT